MNKSFLKSMRILVLILAAGLMVWGCTEATTPEDKVLASIGDYQLKLSEFQRLLSADLEMNPDFKLTRKAKKEYLDEIIQKEILVIEAKKRRLDVEPKFIRTIERYWESTLIRSLMEIISEEIEKKIIVTQEEIRNRYNSLKAEDPSMPPFSEIEEETRYNLKEEKKNAAYQEWVAELEGSIKIEIDNNLLNQN